MRVLLLTALLAIPASAATGPSNSVLIYSGADSSEPVFTAPTSDKSVINPSTSAAAGLCPPTAAQVASERARRADGALFHKLTELPPANGYVAVYREVDGCEVPIMVRYGVGGSEGGAHK